MTIITLYFVVVTEFISVSELVTFLNNLWARLDFLWIWMNGGRKS